jgi:hypothetical protein
MTLSGDNIRDIAIALITAINSSIIVIVPIMLRRQTRIREKVDVVDTKVSGVAAAVDKVHALVDSQHSELKGELKTYKEFTDQALGLSVNREGMSSSPKNPNQRDD